jgi:hypothetical protein
VTHQSLVEEKETRMRETMYMMGLRSDALWLSWAVHFLALWVPLSLLLTACSRQLFTFSEPGYVLLYFLVFFVSTTAYGVLVATVFNQSRTAAVAGCLVYFVGFYAFQGQQNAQPTYVPSSLEPSAEHTHTTFAVRDNIPPSPHPRPL